MDSETVDEVPKTLEEEFREYGWLTMVDTMPLNQLHANVHSILDEYARFLRTDLAAELLNEKALLSRNRWHLATVALILLVFYDGPEPDALYVAFCHAPHGPPIASRKAFTRAAQHLHTPCCDLFPPLIPHFGRDQSGDTPENAETVEKVVRNMIRYLREGSYFNV